MRAAADAGKMDIMDQVPQENVCRTAETGFEKPLGTRKKMLRRVAIVTAAAMVLGIGSFASVARQGYQVAEYPEQYEKKREYVITNNVSVVFPEDRMDDAYRQIADTLDIKVVALDHLPSNMKFDNFYLSNTKGILKLLCGDKKIYLEEKILDEQNTISILTTDRKVVSTVKNEWLDKEIKVKEKILESGDIEYSIQFATEFATYYLSGMMDKNEFIEIVENLYYWN